MNEMTWQYIAGFFDGEGNVQSRCMPNGRHVSKVRFTQREHSSLVLYAIANFLADNDFAYSIERQHTGGDWQVVLTISRKVDTLRLLRELAEHCLVKHGAILKAIEDLERYFKLKEKYGNQYVEHMHV